MGVAQRQTMRAAILFTAVLTYINSIAGLALEDVEGIAFQICDTDEDSALTWNEVEACEETYSNLIQMLGLSLPTEDDFNDQDSDKNGLLTFQEWKNIHKENNLRCNLSENATAGIITLILAINFLKY